VLGWGSGADGAYFEGVVNTPYPFELPNSKPRTTLYPRFFLPHLPHSLLLFEEKQLEEGGRVGNNLLGKRIKGFSLRELG
jgi:hypothetical protein